MAATSKQAANKSTTRTAGTSSAGTRRARTFATDRAIDMKDAAAKAVAEMTIIGIQRARQVARYHA